MPMKDTTMIDTTMPMKDTTMMDTTMQMKDTTMMDTTMMDTTMMDTPKPTEAFEMYGELVEALANKKCQSGTGARTFKNSFSDFIDVATCVKQCRDDKNCKYATTDGTTHCIGCNTVPTAPADNWEVYRAFDARRQLTAQEVLRIENAALRAQLDKLM